MANPQKENGFTAIANEILESVKKFDFLGSEFRVIICVLRKTYGFQKKTDYISLTQFESSTGLSRPTVVKALKNLIENNVITRDKNLLKFNKDWESWGSKAVLTSKGGLTSKAVLTRTSKHRFTETGKARLTHKRKKETIKRNNVLRTENLKTMKKNSFNYNENNTSDSYEDVIDLESNERAVPKSNTSAKVRELVDWAVNRRGRKFISYPKQYKAINQLKNSDQNITPEDIKRRWIEMEQDTFWQDKGFDFMSVMSSFERKPLK